MSAAAATAAEAGVKMDGGHVKSFRRKWQNKIFRDFREVAIWAWMCDTAQAEPYRMPTKYGTVELGTGELIIAERELSEKFFISRHAVRQLLDRMENDGMIVTDVNRKPHETDRKINRLGTVVRIVKYELYQYSNDEVVETKTPQPQPQVNRKVPKNNISTYVDTIEPDGSIEPISPPADDRQGLGTKDALPGQMPLPVVADMPPMTEPPEPSPPPAPPDPARPNAGVVALPTKPKPAEVAEEMRVIWNEVCGDAMQQIRVLTPQRITGMTTALRKHFGGDLRRWRAYCERLRASPFMCGANDRGWIGGIDTCMTSKTIIKTFEGCYDDREPRNHRNQKSGLVTFLEREAHAELDRAAHGADRFGWG
jgi:hypothetical protein